MVLWNEYQNLACSTTGCVIQPVELQNVIQYRNPKNDCTTIFVVQVSHISLRAYSDFDHSTSRDSP